MGHPYPTCCRSIDQSVFALACLERANHQRFYVWRGPSETQFKTPSRFDLFMHNVGIAIPRVYHGPTASMNYSSGLPSNTLSLCYVVNYRCPIPNVFGCIQKSGLVGTIYLYERYRFDFALSHFVIDGFEIFIIV